MNKAKNRVDEQAIRAFVTHRYITDGKDSTVKEIAEGVGASEASIRRIINGNRFNLDGWASTYQDTRSSSSTNYPGFSSGVHKVWFYGPSREYMAKIIRTEENVGTFPWKAGISEYP